MAERKLRTFNRECLRIFFLRLYFPPREKRRKKLSDMKSAIKKADFSLRKKFYYCPENIIGKEETGESMSRVVSRDISGGVFL